MVTNIMKGTAHKTARLILAMALSIFMIHTLHEFTPDTHPSGASSGATPLSPALIAQAEAHLQEQAKLYRIPTPKLVFADDARPGFTTDPTSKNLADPATINLGTPIQSSTFASHPDWIKAVASHELGHAVMFARSQAFPVLLVISMYLVGLTIVLVGFPTLRGIILAALLCIFSLTILVWLPVTKHRPDKAVLWLLFCLPLLAGMLLLLKDDVARHSPLRVIRWMKPLSPHVPSLNRLIVFGFIGLAAYLAASYVIGGMNAEREIRADVIGACAVSPESMADALSAISPATPSSATFKAVNEFLDAFHPPMETRRAVLGELRDPGRYRQVCGQLKTGKGQVSLRGIIIQ